MAEVEAAGTGAGGSPEAGTGTGSGWRRPHGPLQRYYGPPAAETAEAAPDPADINGPHFDPEVFLTKVTFDPTATSSTPPGAPEVVVETPPADTPRGTPQTPPDRELRGPPGRPRGPYGGPQKAAAKSLWDPFKRTLQPP